MNENENLGEKRVLETSEKKGLQIRDLILVAVLLAAGAVLKFFVGSLINIGGMKPNFIIAMYCMAIALINPNVAAATVRNEDVRLFFSRNSPTVGRTYTARLMIQSCIGIL